MISVMYHPDDVEPLESPVRQPGGLECIPP